MNRAHNAVAKLQYFKGLHTLRVFPVVISTFRVLSIVVCVTMSTISQPASTTGAVPAASPTSAGRGCDGVHVVLLGDSVLNNASYVSTSEPDVGAQVQDMLEGAVLPISSTASRRTTMLAVDGAVTTGIQHQVSNIPADATHIVLSIGGNDALRARTTVATQPAGSVADALLKLHSLQREFEKDYTAALERVLACKKPVLLIIPYYPSFQDETENGLAAAGMSLYADVIYRAAGRHSLSVLDLRLLFTEPGDYSTPIEPSRQGGRKIAMKVVEFLVRRPQSA